MTPQPLQRTERVIAVTLGLFRLAQHLPFVAVSIGGWTAYARPGFMWWLFVISLAWSGWLFAHIYRRGGLKYGWVFADVAFYATITILVGRGCLPGHELAWDNWSVGPAGGAGAVAAVYLTRRFAAACIPALAVAYVIGLAPLGGDTAGLAATVGNVAGLLIFPVTGGLAAATIRRSAREAESASQREFALRLERDTERLLFDDRIRQYRLLHDTVLSTLSAIARGGLDHRTPEVQKRCADDADFLRGLVTGMSHDTPTSLAAALADVSRAHADMGLEVRQQYDALPDSLPPEAIEAIALAVRESLNNVVKHAGTPEAWVTAAGDDAGGVRVTVTDRGVGFQRAAGHGGFGINQSIRGRIRSVGGRARVHSWEGQGTEVEIEWPMATL